MELNHNQENNYDEEVDLINHKQLLKRQNNVCKTEENSVRERFVFDEEDIMNKPLFRNRNLSENSESKSENSNYDSKHSLCNSVYSMASNFNRNESKSLEKTCGECECCLILLRQIEDLNRQICRFENLYRATPDVIKWFDHIKRLLNINTNVFYDRNNYLSDLSINQIETSSNFSNSINNKELIDIINGNNAESFRQSNANISLSTNNNNVNSDTNKPLVPEIVIENF